MLQAVQVVVTVVSRGVGAAKHRDTSRINSVVSLSLLCFVLVSKRAQTHCACFISF